MCVSMKLIIRSIQFCIEQCITASGKDRVQYWRISAQKRSKIYKLLLISSTDTPSREQLYSEEHLIRQYTLFLEEQPREYVYLYIYVHSVRMIHFFPQSFRSEHGISYIIVSCGSLDTDGEGERTRYSYIFIDWSHTYTIYSHSLFSRKKRRDTEALPCLALPCLALPCLALPVVPFDISIINDCMWSSDRLDINYVIYYTIL